MTLRHDLAGLPDDALVTVGWVRERLDADPESGREVQAG